MVFEKPAYEIERTTNEFKKGRRAAQRGESYFNPYSKVSQRKKYDQFQYGWDDYNQAIDPGEVIKKSKYPQLAVLILGIILTAACYYAFFQ